MNKIPWITLGTVSICMLLATMPDLFMSLAYARQDSNQWWRFATASFVHYDAYHLVTNSLALACLGSLLERKSGHRKVATLIFVNILMPVLLIHFLLLEVETFAGISCVNYALMAYLLAQYLGQHLRQLLTVLCLLGLYQFFCLLATEVPGPAPVPIWQVHLASCLAGLAAFLMHFKVPLTPQTSQGPDPKTV